MESLEARVKELETLLKSEEDRNIEIDKNFKKALYDLTCESQVSQ
jgi:hypothetical protein